MEGQGYVFMKVRPESLKELIAKSFQYVSILMNQDYQTVERQELLQEVDEPEKGKPASHEEKSELGLNDLFKEQDDLYLKHQRQTLKLHVASMFIN